MSTIAIVHPTNLSIQPSIKSGATRISSPENKQLPAQDTDTAVFGELIQSHRDACIKRAFLIMRNHSEAEDVVQNAFRKAFQHRDQFKGEGSFAAWLHRIVENECLMRLRGQGTARFVYLDKPIDSNNRLEVVSSETNPEDELGREEVGKVLREEMLHMPAIFRNVMLLYDKDQVAMPEVAERLGLSVPAAKSRLLRARRELRWRLEKHCGRKGPGTLLETAAHSRTAYARAI